jgi:quinone-modifying oxidoreductase subunit QmoC
VFSYRRITEKQRAGKNTYSDMLFLTVLLATAITGYLCEFLRLAAIRELAYPMYYVHLVSVFFLLVYFPYSKLSHVIYRTLAMIRESAEPRNTAVAA